MRRSRGERVKRNYYYRVYGDQGYIVIKQVGKAEAIRVAHKFLGEEKGNLRALKTTKRDYDYNMFSMR